jgi:hypothetical protein
MTRMPQLSPNRRWKSKNWMMALVSTTHLQQARHNAAHSHITCHAKPAPTDIPEETLQDVSNVTMVCLQLQTCIQSSCN